MRFAFCNEGFGDTPWESVCRAIAAAGYQGVEIAPFTFSEDIRTVGVGERAEIKRAADRAGIEVVGLHWLLARTSLHIAHPDRTVREATSEYLRALAGFCADLGGRIMVFGSPKQRGGTAGATLQQAWEWAKEVFAGALPALVDRGVSLCLEPLSPTDPEGTKDTDFVNTAAEARRFVEEMNHPNMRLLLDVRSMSSEGKPISEIIGESADLLAHFHANDANDQGPGFGEVGFRPILQALRKTGYAGYVSVEPFKFDPDAETVAQRSLRYLEECLKA